MASSKTSGSHQQSLCHFDVTLAAFLNTLLSRIGLAEELWPFSQSHFRACFSALVTFFELESLQLVPYSIRSGGATHFYVKTNNLDSAIIRGRWREAATARQYLDDARATLVRLQIPSSSQQLLKHFRALFLAFAARCASGQVMNGS